MTAAKPRDLSTKAKVVIFVVCAMVVLATWWGPAALLWAMGDPEAACFMALFICGGG